MASNDHVAQFHARDAEGRIYPVREFHDLKPDETGQMTQVVTYRLVIGDRVNHLGGDEFELIQSGIKLTRVS